MKKVNLNPFELKKKLSALYSVISSTTILSILECFLISVKDKKMKISGTDLESYLSLTIDIDSSEEFIFCVNAKLFHLFIRNAISENVTIEVKENEVLLSSDNFKSTVKLENVNEYVKEPIVEGESFIVSQKLFCKRLSNASKFVGNDDLRPALTAVYIEAKENKMFIASTDAHQMYFDDIIIEKKNESKLQALISLKGVNLICKNLIEEEPLVITISKTNIKINSENFCFYSRLVEVTKFIDYMDVVPKNEFNFYLNRKKFISFIKLAVNFSNSYTHQVRMYVTDKCIKVISVNEDSEASFEYSLPVFNPTNECNFIFDFNIKMIRKITDLLKDEFIKINHSTLPTKPFIINDNFLMMPVLANKYD